MNKFDDKVDFTQQLVIKLLSKADNEHWNANDIYDVGCWFIGDVIGSLAQLRVIPLDELEERIKETLSNYLTDVFDNIGKQEQENSEKAN